jgi:hypothetical protein
MSAVKLLIREAVIGTGLGIVGTSYDKGGVSARSRRIRKEEKKGGGRGLLS